MTYRLLFVDDEPNVLAAMSRHFQDTYQVHLAEDGRQALDMLESAGPFDVIVSDLRMPRLDGLGLLAEASRRYPETVRIILTGHADLGNALDAVNQCQAFRILAKPCPTQELEKAVAAAIEHRRLVQDRRELAALRKVKQAMEGIIKGFTNLVEARDPYTAGHQLAVSELAAAIGRAMGLDADRLLGIRMSGLVHDIGKVYVPTEFLNKPGKLSDLEFAVIKNHAQIGSEILSPIDFPWPIVRIVREHHERLDGSGYPHGLQAEAICLEAKVIMVADTVDAMTSHRPYRPGMGLAKALDELRVNAGKLYDQPVVDACLSLFQGSEGQTTQFSWRDAARPSPAPPPGGAISGVDGQAGKTGFKKSEVAP